jgi:rhamnosyl/mannosyltransferase
MPRVLHLYKDVFPPVYGGIEVVLGKLAAHQASRGWEVSVAVAGPVDPEWGRRKGVEVLQVGQWGRLLSNPLSPGFLKVMREHPYDVLHLHLPCPTVVLAALLCGRRQAPWFVSYQSDIVRQRISGAFYSPVEKKFFSKVSRIFVSSPRLMETSLALRRFQDKCRVVPLGISGDDLSAQDLEEAAAIRARYGNRPLVLFVGRFRWYKGLPVLLDAMDKIDALLLVVGSGSSAQEERLRDQAAGLRHPERVAFLGTIERLAPLLAAADVFCLPSTHRAEAFGYVLLEAFRAGLPAVTTELGTGTSYVNVDGKTGFVVPPRDSNALARAIESILSDRSLRERFSMTARERVSEEFSLEKMVDSILENYQEALASKQSCPP